MNYLSLNKNRWEVSPRTSSQFCSQAFKTAGSLFEVIDANTSDVIVPYNAEAEEIINRLKDLHGNKSQLLRKAQRYTVSIYSGTERKLSENNALRILKCGAVVLEHGRYNDELGVDIDNAEKEVLIF